MKKTDLNRYNLFVALIGNKNWSWFHEITMCGWMAGQFSFGKTEVCMCTFSLPKEDCTVIPEPHNCMHPLPISHARVATLIQQFFYTAGFAPAFGYAGERNGICRYNSCRGSILVASWPRGPSSLSPSVLYRRRAEGLKVSSWHLVVGDFSFLFFSFDTLMKMLMDTC